MLPRLFLKNLKSNFLRPQEVVKDFGLKEGDVVIDFGAGSGFWSIPITQIVGNTGKVYVTDPRVENLSIIKKKAEKLGLRNIQYIQAPYDSPAMPIKVKADLILISNILSIIKNDKKLVTSTARNSHKETKLVIIDWDEGAQIGPEKTQRIKISEIMDWASVAGFNFKRSLDVGAHHFGLYFERRK